MLTWYAELSRRNKRYAEKGMMSYLKKNRGNKRVKTVPNLCTVKRYKSNVNKLEYEMLILTGENYALF